MYFFVFAIFYLSAHSTLATLPIECSFKHLYNDDWQTFYPKQRGVLYQETEEARFFLIRPFLSQERCRQSNALQTVIYATRLNGNTSQVEGFFKCCLGPFRPATLMRKNLVLAKLVDQKLYFYQTLWQVSYGSDQFLLPQGLLPKCFFKFHFHKLPRKCFLVDQDDRDGLGVPPVIALSSKDLPCSRRTFKLKQESKEIPKRRSSHCQATPSPSREACVDGAYKYDHSPDAPPPSPCSDIHSPKA